MCETFTGSIDVLSCPRRWGHSGDCRCVPRCAWCGHGPHMAAHGPRNKEPIGGQPYGHAYAPRTAVGTVMCPSCLGLGVVRDCLSEGDGEAR